MKVTHIEKLNQLISRTDMTGNQKVDWLTNFIDEHVTEQLRLYGVSVSLPSDPMVLAEYLHDNYEQIAKRTNWQTQKNCKVEFKDLPLENKNTMILLAGKLILDFVGNER